MTVQNSADAIHIMSLATLEMMKDIGTLWGNIVAILGEWNNGNYRDFMGFYKV